MIYNEDCLLGMKKLDDESIDICFTSPPYNLGISYSTYDDNKDRREYLNWLNEVFIQIQRVIKPDGHFWLNVGYSNADPWIGMDVAMVARNHFILQNNITWVKSISIDNVTRGHFKPINSERYSAPTWEHLFHFTKTGKVRCDKLAIGVPYMDKSNLDRSDRLESRWIKKMGYKNKQDFNINASTEEKNMLADRLSKYSGPPDSRDRGNCWFVPYETITQRNTERGSHPATFPTKLVEMAIQYSDVTGKLLDPFMGTGTSAVAAIKNNLEYIGFEIDEKYIDFANTRLANMTYEKLFGE